MRDFNLPVYIDRICRTWSVVSSTVGTWVYLDSSSLGMSSVDVLWLISWFYQVTGLERALMRTCLLLCEVLLFLIQLHWMLPQFLQNRIHAYVEERTESSALCWWTNRQIRQIGGWNNEVDRKNLCWLLTMYGERGVLLAVCIGDWPCMEREGYRQRCIKMSSFLSWIKSFTPASFLYSSCQ